jgi:hypothetical protein
LGVPIAAINEGHYWTLRGRPRKGRRNLAACVEIDLICWSGVRPTIWPIVPAFNDDEECGAVGGMRMAGETGVNRKKPAVVPHCSTDTIHVLTRHQTRDADVRSRLLTA